MTSEQWEEVKTAAKKAGLLPGRKLAISPTPSTRSGPYDQIVHICTDRPRGGDVTIHLELKTVALEDGTVNIFVGKCPRCRLVILKESL